MGRIGTARTPVWRPARHYGAEAGGGRLRASEARFRILVDHASDAFFLYNEDATVLDVNRQACENLGYRRDELIGHDARSTMVRI